MSKFFGRALQSKFVRDNFGGPSWFKGTSQNGVKTIQFNGKTATKVFLACSLLGYIAYDKGYKSTHVQCATLSKQQVYSWGWGSYGQLGLGSENNAPIPTRIEELQAVEIKQIAARSLASAALTQDGKVYTWGRAKGGALGHADYSAANITLPTMLSSLMGEKITQLACGYQHMAAINSNGELFTWGNSDHGRLGHQVIVQEKTDRNTRRMIPRSPNNTLSTLPQKVAGELTDKRVKQVSCGHLHTVAIGEDDELYVWGSKNSGVLGFKSQQDVPLPQRLPFFSGKGIVKVAAGYDYNLALDKNGTLYSWGSNDYGQLGNPSKGLWDAPEKVSALEGLHLVDVSCGENFAAALSKDGQVYTWGAGIDGQLGHGDRSDLKAPRLLDFELKVKALSCGSGHTAIITENNQLYMFGRGREGQLGRADTIESSVTYRTRPQRVEGFKTKKVVQVQCGGDHSMALVE